MPKKRAARGRRGGATKRSGAREKELKVDDFTKNERQSDDSKAVFNIAQESAETSETHPKELKNIENKEDAVTEIPVCENEKSNESGDVKKDAQISDGEVLIADDLKHDAGKEDDKSTTPETSTQQKGETFTQQQDLCDPASDTCEIISTDKEIGNDDNAYDAQFFDEVEEAFIDKASDEDIQYIDEEIIEEKDQELCDVLEGPQDDMVRKTEDKNNDRIIKSKEIQKSKNDAAEDNNFEEISEGSMDAIEQCEIIEAISDNEIVIDIRDEDADKDGNNDAAETLEQVFLATESDNADKILVEDKDNDDISDTSLCGDEDKDNLSLEEISDEELDSSKKRHMSRSEDTPQTGGKQKINAQDEEQNSATVEVVNSNAKRRLHLENDKDKNEIPSKKMKSDSDSDQAQRKPEEYGDAAFFTNISSFPGKPKEGGKPASLNPSKKSYVPKNTISKDLTSCQQVSISTQTHPISKRGKIVQCNISPISEEVPDKGARGKDEDHFSSKLFEQYKNQLPTSITDIFQEVTSTEPPKQGYYQFSMGPVTHADIDCSEFRDIALKFVERFQLCFNSRHQGIFSAQLSKQESVAYLIRGLKRLELGTRYMVFSVIYRHGLGHTDDSLWKASVVFMYSQDRQIEKQKVVSDGKERARLSVDGVPNKISKDFIQMLLPESLYISSRLGPSLERSLTLGYSSYGLVEETTTCYELLLINGQKITMSTMDPIKERTNTSEIDPGYVDENGIVLIPDSEENEVEEISMLKSLVIESNNIVVDDNSSTQMENDLPMKDVVNVDELSKADSTSQEEGTDKNGIIDNQCTVPDQTVTNEHLFGVVSEPVSCSEFQTELDGHSTALLDEEKKEKETVSKDSASEQKTENEASTVEEDLPEEVPTIDLVNLEEAENGDKTLKQTNELPRDDSTTKEESSQVKGEENQVHEKEPVTEVCKNTTDSSEHADNTTVTDLSLQEPGLQAELKTVEIGTTEVSEHIEASATKETEADLATNIVEIESLDKREISKTTQSNETVIEKEKCEKDTSLEDVSDDEMINTESKHTDVLMDSDVIILQEDPSKRIVAEIDLTEDVDETTSKRGAEEKRKATEKLSLTDGNLQVTMEAIDVEEEPEEPERVLYANRVPWNKDSYSKSKESRHVASHLFPGSRLITRQGEIYVPRANNREWHQRYDYYKNDSSKNYEQVSSIRSGSSLADYTYEASNAPRTQRLTSGREKNLEHRDTYRREYRRSKSPSPRRDQGFDRKTSQQQQRQADQFQHSRQMYSKEYTHSYGYGTANNNQGRGFSEWHTEASDPKRRDAYLSAAEQGKVPYHHSRSPPYDGHKGWKEVSYQSKPNRKSPNRLPSVYEVKQGPSITISNFHSDERRTQNRYRRTLSRSLSPLSDKSLSSSSYLSRDRRSRTRRSKASFPKRISRSPISISSRSQSLSPVSKSPSPQKYHRTNLYKSRRDQYSPLDRSRNHRAYKGRSRSRSRSPFWSKSKAKSRSRSPSYKKKERSPPYKRAALSPVTNRDRALDKHVTTAGTKSAQSSWQTQNEKNRATASYEPSVKSGDVKSTTFGNYPQQGPPPNYGFPAASVNYSTPPATFAQWPASTFPPPAGYTPQQPLVYSNPSVTAPYNYSGVSNYTNVSGYSAYPYNMPPASGNDPNQVPHANYNPYTATTSQGASQLVNVSNLTGGSSSSKKATQSSQLESSAKKWSMGGSGSGGALVFQRILSNVNRSKK